MGKSQEGRNNSTLSDLDPHDAGDTETTCNGIAKPVLLNIINPLFENIFFPA